MVDSYGKCRLIYHSHGSYGGMRYVVAVFFMTSSQFWCFLFTSLGVTKLLTIGLFVVGLRDKKHFC